MSELFEEIRWRIVDLFEHNHKYSLSQIAIYTDKEHREHPSGIPVVAWKYKCKCGAEIIEYDESGIRLLQKGLSEDEVISKWI